MNYLVRTFAERSDRLDDNWRIIDEGWKPLAVNDPVGDRYFGRLYPDFPDDQFMLYDGETVAATCNSIPVAWNLDDAALPDEGWDWALESGFALRARDAAPTTLCAISITVARGYLGQGLSQQCLAAMKQIAVRQGYNALIAPVRPTLKARYPLTPMERYIRWTREDGAPFDPWLRTHWRAGARIVKVARRSMVTPGTVAQWEGWTDMKFPESGEYVVPDALNPITVDLERDLVTYVEPNVWMHHPIP
jgi:GNAT superfamily N-acetyltransferase